ncbi:hypothetical protein MSAN_01770200 [Mycena sanguinolenta]|uniref:Uncharacterized protein n=1 Tax=Mycena sanguinolenta TaxID=230812 RepID=A0A8H6XV77_9AGAR|nr:hypothetical protein MSAN_01770200 [Mycena sanguinolenta]
MMAAPAARAQAATASASSRRCIYKQASSSRCPFSPSSPHHLHARPHCNTYFYAGGVMSSAVGSCSARVRLMRVGATSTPRMLASTAFAPLYAGGVMRVAGGGVSLGRICSVHACSNTMHDPILAPTPRTPAPATSTYRYAGGIGCTHKPNCSRQRSFMQS